MINYLFGAHPEVVLEVIVDPQPVLAYVNDRFSPVYIFSNDIKTDRLIGNVRELVCGVISFAICLFLRLQKKDPFARDLFPCTAQKFCATIMA
jgi:hypothetical protein